MDKKLNHLLWVEKIKLTQYIFNLTGQLSEKQLEFIPPGGYWSIRQDLEYLRFIDSLMQFSFPLSVSVSSILPLKELDEGDIELDMERLYNLYPGPLLPGNLGTIEVEKASQLLLDGFSKEMRAMFESWKKALENAEKYLSKLEIGDCKKKRFFSVLGIFSIPAGIDLHTVYSSHFFLEKIKKAMEHSDFPKN
ncbi:MAG: hypothetical protein H7A25_07795 [Leptospiraceae bacterium]|nr:hypothetical protein [Leptospiraceae bacterium]MCP5499787.1 hypothetical protein [Leptospiraceae bacterium]